MKNESMFPTLDRFENALLKLLKDEASWKSVYVNYSAPLVERLWQEWEEGRGFIHDIHTCEFNQSLYHKHNWPSAMKIVSGAYEMGIGYGTGDTPPPIATTIILPAGSRYEMTDPDGWHYVRPLTPHAYSIMVTGIPWGTGAPKSERPLRTLTDEELKRMFDFFRAIYK